MIVNSAFFAERPIFDGRDLPEGNALFAENVYLKSGAIEPLPKPVTLGGPNPFSYAGATTLYRFFDKLIGVSLESSFAESPVINDPHQRLYYSIGDTAQVTTYNNIINALPVNQRRLGIPSIRTFPGYDEVGAIAAVNNSNPGVAQKSTAFVVTFLDDWDQESAPSFPTVVIDYNDGNSVTISNIPVSPLPYITSRLIYMSIGNDYFLLKTIPNNTATSITFNIEDDTVTRILETEEYAIPPDNLKGLTGFPNGVLGGFTNDLNSGTVYFCVPFRPHAWPVKYAFKVKYRIVRLVPVTNGIIVLTEGKPSFISGGTPDVMVVNEIDSNQKCISWYTVADTEGGAFYACPDGIALASSNGIQVVSSTILSKEQWAALNPEDYHFGVWERRLVMYSQNEGYMFDFARNEMSRLTEKGITALYYDYSLDDLLYVQGATVHRFAADPTDNYDYTYTSKEFTINGAVPLNSLRIEADHYPVTFSYNADGRVFSKSIMNNKPVRMQNTGRRRSINYTLSGKSKITSVQLAESMEMIR